MMNASSFSCVVCLVLMASLLLVAASAVTVTPTETRPAAAATKTTTPDEGFLARLCDQQGRRARLPWCKQLHAARRRGGVVGGRRVVAMPPPSRDGEEIDPRFGVSKRLVPTGPNPLHH
ncbi:hypothetical protein GUJ93_ZPchr0007g6080 [Zizania palustris]|uniref:Uncharacterized protein n=1 Tax=Zizania palustris TaxID=103762 RepID=A0A8J5SK18_ZIZPA|nr:hypothetical protein GUJ93_ZPchr0007g6080 [Zizania palustris]